jgi:hypothetical protein
LKISLSINLTAHILPCRSLSSFNVPHHVFQIGEHVSPGGKRRTNCTYDCPHRLYLPLLTKLIPDDAGNEKTPDEGPKDTSNSAPQGVRFASGVEEIEPVKKDITKTASDGQKSMENLTPEVKEEIRSLAMTLQKSKLQESRMSNFQFEPVSLPASRVRSSVKASSSQNIFLLSALHVGLWPQTCSHGVVWSYNVQIFWSIC